MIDRYINNRLVILYFIPFILGSLTVFSFQPFNLTFINFFVLPLFFYLLIFIKKRSKSTYRKKPYKKNFFIFGTMFGFGYFLAGLHWITNSLTFDENFKILIPFGVILIPLFLSLFFSTVSVILGPFLSLNLSSIFLLSSGLAFSDYLRAKILTGFPWNLWSYSFAWNNEILQILNLIGLFAFNCILITFFMFPAILFLKFNYIKKFILLSLIPFIFFLLYVHGNYLINKNQKYIASFEKKYFIKVVSPNFELNFGLSKQDIENRLKKLIRYSDPSGEKKTLFIWPEGAFSGYNYRDILDFKKIFSENFSKNHFILFGINKAGLEKNKFYNNLIIVDHQLNIINEYKKQKLVPFGEFLPLEKILHKFGIKKITEGYGSFLKGGKQNNLIIDAMNILPLICYEIIFTELIQRSDDDTNLIINISEDGWFGQSIGPYQHFSKSVFRAIEQDSYLVRSANKGISAIINNKGEIVKRLNPYEAGNIELEVPLIQSNNKNKNDLIFFILLFTNILLFKLYKKNDKR